MTLSATGCLFLLIWRSFDPKCREFPLLGVKNGWDWPSLEWQGGCMTLSTRNTILTLWWSEFASHTVIIMTFSRLYSECHESLLPQRESFEGDREKAITRGATWKRDHPDDGLSVSERNIWCWESTLRTDRNPSGFKWSYHTAFNIEPFILHSPLIGSTQMVPTS